MKEFPGQVGVGLLTRIQRNENGDCFLQSPDRDYNPFQYSCVENTMDRGAGQATVHAVSRVRHVLAISPPSPHVKDGLLLAFA